MPFQDEGGVVRSGRTVGLLNVQTVGIDNTGASVVSEQPRTIDEAVAVANQSVKILPTATAPAVDNLPAGAGPGEFYVFASQPGTVYFLGPDNVWRALLAVAVS